MELAIDTSTETAGIALSTEGKLDAELTWHAGQNHTRELVPSVVFLLRQARASLNDIRGLVVAEGPGSFNGLRVGMSVAKGLSLALGIPLVGVGTLEVEAFPYAFAGPPVCPIMNAGRGEIATALFQSRHGKWCRVRQEYVTTVDVLLSDISGPTIFCGAITDEMASRIKERLGRRALLAAGVARRPGYLAQLGWLRLKDSDADHSPTLQPLYLRRPSITLSGRR